MVRQYCQLALRVSTVFAICCGDAALAPRDHAPSVAHLCAPMAMSTNTGWAQPEYLNLNNSALEPSPAPGLQQGPVLRLG